MKRVRLLLLFAGVVLLGAAGVTTSRAGAREERSRLAPVVDRPPLYLPKLQYVRLLSLGYDTILSRLLLFSSINYFGKRLMSGKDIHWFGHMCELTIGLNPRPSDPIEFCTVILAWMAKDPITAEKLLTLGIKFNPDYWRLFYMRGFVRWYFLEDMTKAQEDMVSASHTSDAPAFVQSIASKLMASNSNAAIAKQFLHQMLQRTKDPAAQKVLEEQFHAAELAEHLEMFKKAVTRYRETVGSEPTVLEDLVKGGVLKAIPPEPFAGKYELDAVTREVKSTSGKKPLSFVGKTAKTGIWAEQFQDMKVQ